jgi:hypothetical protein
MTDERHDRVAADGEDDFARNQQIVDDSEIKRAGQKDAAPDAIGETRLGQAGIDIEQAVEDN